MVIASNNEIATSPVSVLVNENEGAIRNVTCSETLVNLTSPIDLSYTSPIPFPY
jgi:hypothetical protein